MRNLVLTIASLGLLAGCVSAKVQERARGHEARRGVASVAGDPERARLTPEILRMQELVEQALVWRVKAVDFAAGLKARIKSGTLEHDDLEALHTKAVEYLEYRGEMLRIVERYKWSTDPLTHYQFEPGKGTTIRVSRAADGGENAVVAVDPTDAEGRNFLMHMKISLGAALVLYDNYITGIYPFQKSKALREKLNRDNPRTVMALQEITDSFLSVENRKRISVAISRVNQDLAWKKANGAESDREEQYLEALIFQSPAYSYLLSGKKLADFTGISEAAIARMTDDLSYLQRVFTYVTSYVFGNVVGLVQFRKGHMTRLPAGEIAEIGRSMQPLDILLEKTPFRLTDKFIPGHYGHVAIWVGDEEQLRAIGVWDHPTVAKHHDKIREGRRIIEALRPGVEINTLEHFLNIDDLAVLRHPTITDEERREFLIRAFEQVGKDYDFNFDVDTDRRIVCSELAYVVYHNITWPKDKALGRYTISPDHVANKARSGGPLVPVLIYHDGKKVTGRLDEMLPLLLEERYDEAKKLMGELPSEPGAASREPASAGLTEFFKGVDGKLLSDFFQLDTRGKQLRYRVQSRLWTSMDDEYLQEQARRALNDAIARTLETKDIEKRSGEEPSLASRLKGNLMESFLEEFVKTWKFYKIVNGTLQLDLYFLPERDSPSDYGPELASNGLVRMNDTGSLAARLRELDEASFTRRIHAAGKFVPGKGFADGDPLRYVGGVITLNIKILDSRWKPLQKLLPSPRKNAVKGYIRYRRYFAGRELAASDGACGKGAFEGNAAGDRFTTVDVYKTFNLEKLAPKAERLEVFPGRIMAPNKGEDELLPSGSDFVGKTIHGGDYRISAGAADHRVRSLVYSISDGRFDSRRSSLWSTGSEGGEQNRYLTECRDYLISAFHLNRVLDLSGKGGE
ncbi:MAG: hypothetical protein NDJ89_07115 [Oligoflexia bacterium]|nr:hypothetical protein [Oligoflexia bacterium]